MFRFVLLGFLVQACTEYNVVKPADEDPPGEDPSVDTAEPPPGTDDPPADDPRIWGRPAPPWRRLPRRRMASRQDGIHSGCSQVDSPSTQAESGQSHSI